MSRRANTYPGGLRIVPKPNPNRKQIRLHRANTPNLASTGGYGTQSVKIDVNKPILSIEEVAHLLHSSVQAVRNIPPEILPRYRWPGKRLNFRTEEVLRAFDRIPQPQRRGNADELIRANENRTVESSADSGRRRRNRRRRDDQSS